MTFAAQLAAEKDRLGLTLAGLAATLDVGQRTIEHWLAGDRIPATVTQEGVMARLHKRRGARRQNVKVLLRLTEGAASTAG